MWHSNDTFYYMLKAKFATLVTFKLLKFECNGTCH